MALKSLLLRSKLDEKKKALSDLRKKETEFENREKELEVAINEVNEATTEEEKEILETKVEEFTQEKDALEEEKGNLERDIENLEKEIAEEEERSKKAVENKRQDNERSKTNTMENRTKFFGMSIQERDAFFAREDVKEFLQRTRELGRQNRDISGKELLVPTVVLDLIRENVLRYSKLYRHVNVRRVNGKARQVVMGTIPEAVWTEMCANLNELNLSFTNVEVDGYKVGGYIPVCNAVLEDNDINLATEIISALGQAIGLALDKAILYGTGTKMPLGIVTRLAQTQAPDNYPQNARPWVNLSATNLLAITGKTDAALFKALVEASGAAKGVYSRGAKFWAMSEATYTQLIANALSINAAGAIAAGVDGVMPVIGGVIEVLNFIPDGVIIGGFGDLYLLAERADTRIAQSEHAMFIEDNTVFKGTARYDGLPVIAEGFVAVGINGTAPTATMTFAEDEANASTGD